MVTFHGAREINIYKTCLEALVTELNILIRKMNR